MNTTGREYEFQLLARGIGTPFEPSDWKAMRDLFGLPDGAAIPSERLLDGAITRWLWRHPDGLVRLEVEVADDGSSIGVVSYQDGERVVRTASAKPGEALTHEEAAPMYALIRALT